MQELIELLKQKQLTLASCESLTGGLFASKVVDVSGASAVFQGALVTYATAMKEKLANVDWNLIETHGVVSYEVAKAMAINTRSLLESDIAVSFTGNAGPLPTENKPVGLIYSAIAMSGRCVVFEDHLQGTRDEIRHAVVDAMVKRIIDLLQN